MATLYDSGFNKALYKVSSLDPGSVSTSAITGVGGITMPNSDPGTIFLPTSDSSPAQSIASGSLDSILFSKKTSFTDTTQGWMQGVDSTGVYKWIIGGATSSIDWSVTTPGVLTILGSINATTGMIGGFVIGATTLSATSGGNTTTLSSGSIAFSAGPTGSPSITITQAGTLTTTGAIVNGSTIQNNDIFGNGQDGSATINGGTTTLTQDMFYTTLHITSTGVLVTNGFRVFVNGTLTIDASGVIQWNGVTGGAGGNGSTPTGGTLGTGASGLTSGNNLQGAQNGTNGRLGGAGGTAAGGSGSGGTATGIAGASTTHSFASAFTDVGSAGVSGGASGTGGGIGGSGTAAGSTGSISASTIRPYMATFAVIMQDFPSTNLLTYNGIAGGSGSSGGGGAGDSGSGGGGGGSGGNGSDGGTMVLAARIIVNNGTVSVNGGTGGPGGTGGNGGAGNSLYGAGGGGGGSGGKGGAGGVLVALYSSLSGSGTFSASGGAGGAGGAGGTHTTAAGKPGVDGTIGNTPPTASNGVIISLIV